MTLLLLQCTKKPSKFLTYDVQPFKEAYKKNSVDHYISYEVIDGKPILIDSVVFDTIGNVLSKTTFGWHSVVSYKYDSLGRKIHQSQIDDVHSEVDFEYEEDISNRAVKVKAWFVDDKEKKLWFNSVLTYDENLDTL